MCGLHARPGQTSILVGNLCGFTTLAAKLSTTEVMHLLNNLWCVFDSLVEENKVYKCHTPGAPCNTAHAPWERSRWSVLKRGSIPIQARCRVRSQQTCSPFSNGLRCDLSFRRTLLSLTPPPARTHATGDTYMAACGHDNSNSAHHDERIFKQAVAMLRQVFEVRPASHQEKPAELAASRQASPCGRSLN